MRRSVQGRRHSRCPIPPPAQSRAPSGAPAARLSQTVSSSTRPVGPDWTYLHYRRARIQRILNQLLHSARQVQNHLRLTRREQGGTARVKQRTCVPGQSRCGGLMQGRWRGCAEGLRRHPAQLPSRTIRATQGATIGKSNCSSTTTRAVCAHAGAGDVAVAFGTPAPSPSRCKCPPSSAQSLLVGCRLCPSSS